MTLFRRLLLYLAAIGFGLALVIASAISVSRKVGAQDTPSPSTYSQEQSSQLQTNGTATAAALSKDTQVSYYLAYPGILPDHPLYPLKMLRDNMKLLLTTNPTDKFNTLLLYSDKRIGAAQVLVDGGKINLGLSTAFKSEGYLNQAMKLLDANPSPELGNKLHLSTMKHEELLDAMKPKVTGDALNELDRIINTNNLVHEQVSAKYPDADYMPDQMASPSDQLQETQPPDEISL
jgi:hypothetical protein